MEYVDCMIAAVPTANKAAWEDLQMMLRDAKLID